MKKGAIWGAAGYLLLCISACDKGVPTVPGNALNKYQQVETTAGLAVCSSKAAYFIGETETFTASLVKPDGGTVAVTGGTWSSDTPAIATVNDAGMVSVVGQGWANISCTYEGQTGTRQIWGRVDCRGAWSGTYSIEGCQSTGDFLASGFCGTQGGSGLPVELVLTEEGERLAGTITLGGLSTPFVAKPLLDGSLEMEGRVISPPYAIDVAMGCSWVEERPEFCMMLYYTRDTWAGRAWLSCRVSLSKTGVKAL